MVVWVAWLQLGSSRRGLSWLQQDARGGLLHIQVGCFPCLGLWGDGWNSWGLAGLVYPADCINGSDSATITAFFISHCSKFIPLD